MAKRTGKSSRRLPGWTDNAIDLDAVVLTPDAEGLYEHMRRCDDCTTAVLEWSRPMFYAMGEPGGHIRKDMDAFLAQARLNHELVDTQTRMFVASQQALGTLDRLLDDIAREMHGQTGRSVS